MWGLFCVTFLDWSIEYEWVCVLCMYKRVIAGDKALEIDWVNGFECQAS